MTATSKIVYIAKIGGIFNECNNSYHITTKINTINVKDNTYIEELKTLLKNLMTKVLNLKLVIILEYQNTKTFLLKDIFQFCQKKFL